MNQVHRRQIIMYDSRNSMQESQRHYIQILAVSEIALQMLYKDTTRVATLKCPGFG